MNTPAPPAVLPALTKQSAVVVFLHHSGANGLNWGKRFETMRLPHVKYIFPNAPVRALSLYDGAQQTAWYDVHGYSTGAAVDEEGITQATTDLHRLLDEEVALGTPSNRILVAGHSQGGSLAIYATVLYDKALAGSVVMNCWFPDYRLSVTKKFNAANKKTPLVQLHGDKDPFILLKYTDLCKEIARKGEVNFTLKLYKNSSHWPTAEMFEEMKKFIADHLPEITENPCDTANDQTDDKSDK